ncbi:MAG: hypothetical protein R3E79_23905 [Caldilineaceae bacterium]
MLKTFLAFVIIAAIISTPYRSETPVIVRAILQADADPVIAAAALQPYAAEPIQIHFKFPTTAAGYDGGGGMFTLHADSNATTHATNLQRNDWPTATYTHIEAVMPHATALTLPSLTGVARVEVTDPFFMWAAYPNSRPW